MMIFVLMNLIRFFPFGAPTDAIASVTQLEIQLAEIQKLMNQNIGLSKQNRENLIELVDQLVAGADSALVNLQAAQAAHDQLVQLNQSGVSEDSSRSYDEEFDRRIQQSNFVDSETAKALQNITHRSTKPLQFSAVDAQASVQIWQTLNRISMQLQELTVLIRNNHPKPIKLNRFENVLGLKNGGSPAANR